jgi:hypothetical protein
MHTHSPNKVKNFKQTSARKLMATVFWGSKGVLMVEFMQQGTTITPEVYCETLSAIQNKRHGILTYSIVLVHDNALLHAAARTRALLDHFNWELFDHHPYSPDLRATVTCLPTRRTGWDHIASTIMRS